MYLIVGLGNPGKQYEDTRHNVGFKAIDLLADRNNITLNKLKFNGVYGDGFIGGEKVFLLKPQTYMNNSGQSVVEIMNFYKIGVDRLIVLVDDIDIEPYTVRIKAKGSAGTHNGMKSIINHIKDKSFPRVKIGVGKNEGKMDLANFVLSKFPKKDKTLLEETISTSVEAVEEIVSSGVDKAMNKFN